MKKYLITVAALLTVLCASAAPPEGVQTVSPLNVASAPLLRAVTLQDTISTDSSTASATTGATAITATTTAIVKRSSFFNRIINYFKNANIDKTLTKKFDFSVIGGPDYESNTGLGIGVVAAGLYRIDRTDLTLPPSSVGIYSNIATTGFFMIGVKGNNIFKADKFRLDYNFGFFYRPSDFWGVGWDASTYNPAGEYTRLEVDLDINFSIRVAKNLYVGLGNDYNYVKGKKFSNPEYIPSGQAEQYTNIGGGAYLLYDSRDYPNNAYKGIYLKLDQGFYPKFFGNSSYFSRTELVADFYQSAWCGAVIAYDLHAQFNRGDVPWTMIAQLGGPYRMRGYYQGRYRDNDLIEAQVELRQHIWRRMGGTVWAGAGNVFSRIQDFNGAHTLPNAGIGFRWEFKKRVNVRLDYGFGRDWQSGFIFNINEAF